MNTTPDPNRVRPISVPHPIVAGRPFGPFEEVSQLLDIPIHDHGCNYCSNHAIELTRFGSRTQGKDDIVWYHGQYCNETCYKEERHHNGDTAEFRV